MKFLAFSASTLLGCSIGIGSAFAQTVDTASSQSELDMPGYEHPEAKWQSVEDGLPKSSECKDRIRQVREENGQPALDRDLAEPDEEILIAAVDHRIDGCSVLVMRNDTSDVRPLPENSGEVRLIPAE